MTPQSRYYLEWARKELANAQIMLGAELVDDVGRAAYMAGFHAAQALLFERLGKAFKTHGGVHAEFARATRTDSRMSNELRPFLSRAYRLKMHADDLKDDGATVTVIIDALAEAARFVETVEIILTDVPEA